MGNFSVINNLPALAARTEAQVNGTNLQNTLYRISSGLRLRTGADDAAGLVIADNLKGQIRTLQQSVRNANDGVGFLQTADSALGQIQNLLTRAASLLSEAASLDTTNQTDEIDAIETELGNIYGEINRVSNGTKFGGQDVFGATKSVFVGDTKNLVASNSTISVSTNTATIGTGGNLGVSSGVALAAGSQTSVTVTIGAGAGAATATVMLNEVQSAINTVAGQRGTVGAQMNRLSNAVGVMQAQIQNVSSAESQIRDANKAEEVANMTKFQILSQTGIAALAQANSQSQSVLALFR